MWLCLQILEILKTAFQHLQRMWIDHINSIFQSTPQTIITHSKISRPRVPKYTNYWFCLKKHVLWLFTFTANESDLAAFNETVYSAKVLQINTFLSTGNILKMHLTAQYETQQVTEHVTHSTVDIMMQHLPSIYQFSFPCIQWMN
jgi:hypothetical protein